MDLSVIIVNYNGRDLLPACLQAVERTIQDLRYEIIVIDNASTDGSMGLLRDQWPGVHVLANTANVGFAAACNQGLRRMQGRYALLLNTDARVGERAVAELFGYLQGHGKAALACGQLLHADGRAQNAVASLPSLWTLVFPAGLLELLFPRRYPSKRYGHAAPVDIASAIGACIMVRKQTMDEVGLLDERYFFFLEETDWACRMRRAGWRVVFVPAARIVHLQGQTIGGGFGSRKEFYRARYHYFRKWSSRPLYALICGVIFLRLGVEWLSAALAVLLTGGLLPAPRRRWGTYSRLILWHLRGCPV